MMYMMHLIPFFLCFFYFQLRLSGRRIWACVITVALAVNSIHFIQFCQSSYANRYLKEDLTPSSCMFKPVLMGMRSRINYTRGS